MSIDSFGSVQVIAQFNTSHKLENTNKGQKLACPAFYYLSTFFDAAAAAAFKADFLAQAEARNLSRRKPKATTTAGTSGAATATTSSGPKLGGSRAARVRMRAAEEAKGKK